MTRRDMKQAVKSKLNPNFGFFFVMFLPYFILTYLGSVINYNSNHNLEQNLADPSTVSIFPNIFGFYVLISIISGLLMVGIMYVLIDIMRGKDDFEHGFSKSTTILKKNYLLPAIIIGFFNWLFTVLWTILFIIPGIIKSLAYSQAQYIYRDALDRGEQMSYLDAITKSRQLMDGHKGEFFILQWSFFWWILFMIITGGIAGIYVIPYIRLTNAAYYDQLVKSQDPDAQAQVA